MAGHLLAQGAGEVAVEVETVKPAKVWETKSSFAGIVKAKRKSQLSFERSGRVDQIDVEEGLRVQAGQVLARLNTEQLEAQVRKLEADKRAAEALLAELKAGPRQETIDAARADVREQEVQLDLAIVSRRRRENLLKDRLVAREEYDQAQTAVERWEALVNELKNSWKTWNWARGRRRSLLRQRSSSPSRQRLQPPKSNWTIA